MEMSNKYQIVRNFFCDTIELRNNTCFKISLKTKSFPIGNIFWDFIRVSVRAIQNKIKKCFYLIFFCSKKKSKN